jgi:MFS transporter
VLVAARVVQGIGAGAIPAVGYVAIGRAYPTSLQPRMFAILSTAWVLPGVIGPAVSGAVADHVGWRAVFLGLLPLVVFAGAMTIGSPGRIEPEPDVEVEDHRLHALLLTLGAALVLGAASSHNIVLAIPLALIGSLVAVPAFLRLVPHGTLRLAGPLPVTRAHVAPAHQHHARGRRTHRGDVVLDRGSVGARAECAHRRPTPLRPQRLRHHRVRHRPHDLLCDTLGVALGTGATGAAVAAGAAMGWARPTPLLVSFVVLGCVAVIGSVVAARLPRELPASSQIGKGAPVQRTTG